MLTIIFLFASLLMYQQYSQTEVYINNQKTTVNVEYFGTPFEAFGVWHINLRTGVILLWGSAEDILLFSGIASAIVLTVMDLIDWCERERYYRDTV
jgi:hypothetical protein